MTDNIYLQNGYNNREDYLKSLAEDYDVDLDIVMLFAQLYGESEDFDGLVTAMEDYQAISEY